VGDAFSDFLFDWVSEPSFATVFVQLILLVAVEPSSSLFFHAPTLSNVSFEARVVGTNSPPQANKLRG